MRGTADQQETMLTLMTPAKRVPEDHPIRRIKAIADAELERLSPTPSSDTPSVQRVPESSQSELGVERAALEGAG